MHCPPPVCLLSTTSCAAEKKRSALGSTVARELAEAVNRFDGSHGRPWIGLITLCPTHVPAHAHSRSWSVEMRNETDRATTRVVCFLCCEETPNVALAAELHEH